MSFNDCISVLRKLLNRCFFLVYASCLPFLLKVIKSVIYKYLLLEMCYIKLTSVFNINYYVCLIIFYVL